VDVYDRVAPGALVQVVHGHGDEREAWHPALQLGDRPVPVVRLGLEHEAAPILVAAPNSSGITIERLGSCQLHRIEPSPQPGLLVAERQKAGLGRGARARQHSDVLRRP